MSHEAIAERYRELYPDDADSFIDIFLCVGYDSGYKWHGDLYNDGFEALYHPDVRDLLNGRGYEIRRFIRAYNMGAADKPMIVNGNARHSALRFSGDKVMLSGAVCNPLLEVR